MFSHLLHAQPWDVGRWTLIQLLDRVDWVDGYLKPRKDEQDEETIWLD